MTKKLVKVGKLHVHVNIKFASAAPSWPEALLVGATQLVTTGVEMISTAPEIYKEVRWPL